VRVRAAFLGVLLAGCAVVEPPRVSDDEIAMHKAALERGCRVAGVKRHDSQAKIDHYCGCVAETFERSLTRREWEEAILAARSGRDGDALDVLAPYLPRLERCRTAATS
jgi:hypothetical protein